MHDYQRRLVLYFVDILFCRGILSLFVARHCGCLVNYPPDVSVSDHRYTVVMILVIGINDIVDMLKVIAPTLTVKGLRHR